MLREVKGRCENGRVVLTEGRDVPPDGTEVTVIYEADAAGPEPLSALAGRSRPCFASAAEVDAFIREERDSWGS
jgi:hypothetical protein